MIPLRLCSYLVILACCVVSTNQLVIEAGSNVTGETIYYSSTQFTVSRYYYVSASAVNASNHLVDSSAITGSGERIEVTAVNLTNGGQETLLTIDKTVEVNGNVNGFDKVMFSVSVSIDNTQYDAFDLKIYDDLRPGFLADRTTLSQTVDNVNGRDQLTWTPNASSFIAYQTANGGPATLSYDAVSTSSLLQGQTIYSSDINYYIDSALAAADFLSLSVSVCIERINVREENTLMRNGFIALAFFLALFLGIGLVVLVVCLLSRMRKLGPFITRNRINQEKLMKTKNKKLVMDAKDAAKKGLNTIKDYSLIGLDESLVFILTMKDKLQIFRELDSLDIQSTVAIDTSIERERNGAATEAAFILIQSLRWNNDITKQAEEQAFSDFNKNFKDTERKLDEEYRKTLHAKYIHLSAKNKEKMSNLLKKHKNEKIQLIHSVQDTPQEERKSLIKLIDEQQETEENELTYLLKLEQDEETENIRKEFSVRKRMALRELMHNMLENITHDCGHQKDVRNEEYRRDGYKTDRSLPEDKASWLMKEHAKNQAEIEKLYDDEISRQRMVLEEKLARRKALAQSSDLYKDDKIDILNTMAGQQISSINKLKRQNIVSSSTVDDLMKQSKEDMLALKEKMDKQKEKQETELHKKLSALKKQKLAEKEKELQAELMEYDKKKQEQQTEGAIDSLSYVEGRLQITSQHRAEISNLDNQIDMEHAKELEKMRSEISTQTETSMFALQENFLKKMKDQGVTDKQAENIIDQHKKEVQKLNDTQEIERKRQMEKLKDKLNESRRQWADRRAAEKDEQEQLREYESKVTKELLSSQVSMSEEERKRIMQEHEKQMVKLENSLTLNKLRQKRMLEEKLSMKRARQLHDLDHKHKQQINHQRRSRINNAEDSDEETDKDKLKLMNKQAEERIAIMNGTKLNLDEELENVRIEMMKERALGLKDQEERLGALVAAMQMDKAREIAKIEEQQQAINNLKCNLMDDLTERGVFSDPDCQRIIQRHKEEQEQIQRRLESQRKKQEQLLKQKMEERLIIREKSMIQKQESEMKEVIDASPNKTVAKIKRMLVMHKHMIEMERFKNQLDREINQIIEETKRQKQVEKFQYLQEQELNFIAGLVKAGRFHRDEVIDVLHVLFPLKSEADVQQIFEQIYPGTPSPDEDPDHLNSSKRSNLSYRVRSMHRSSLKGRPGSRLSNERERPGSRLSYDRPSSAYSEKSRGSNYADFSISPKKSKKKNLKKYRFGSRTEPDVVEAVPAGYNVMPENSTDEGYYDEDDRQKRSLHPVREMPQKSSRLPPIESTGRKKKKKFLQKRLHKSEDPYDDL